MARKGRDVKEAPKAKLTVAQKLKKVSVKHDIDGKGPWTQFWDMHSGGGLKEEPFNRIYIQAPEEEAKSIFYGLFSHSPDRVSCTCCGADYSASEGKSLALATAYHRGAKWNKETNNYDHRGGKPIAEYIKEEEVLVIYNDMFDDSLRREDVPQQGYVWAGG